MSYQSKVAFIVGNGPTRSRLDLNELVGKAPIYGCNALYRDFNNWDYLVAIDDGMIEELRQTRSRLEKVDGIVIIPPDDKRWEHPEYSPSRRRNNAGMVAMDEAINRGAKVVYAIGMDFILGGSISTDNVYKNSENYGPETHANQNDNYNRIRYLEWYARRHSDVKFVFVRPEGLQTRQVMADNVVVMDTEIFLNKIRTNEKGKN